MRLLDEMVLADGGHGARLGALGAFAVGDDDADLVADFELREAAVGHAVLVKVDLAPVRHLDEAVALGGEQARHLAVRRHRVGLDLAADLARVVFELARRRVEGVADGHVDVLVGVVPGAGVVDHDLLAGHADVDAHVVELALGLAPVRRLDHDAAADDALEVALELAGLFPDVGLDGLGRLHVAEGDLHWGLHLRTSRGRGNALT